MATIKSSQKRNDTGVDPIKGHTYNYQATGQWKDWFIPSDADGFSNFLMDLFSWTKRTPSAKWFQLIGVVEMKINCFFKMFCQKQFSTLFMLCP